MPTNSSKKKSSKKIGRSSPIDIQYSEETIAEIRKEREEEKEFKKRTNYHKRATKEMAALIKNSRDERVQEQKEQKILKKKADKDNKMIKAMMKERSKHNLQNRGDNHTPQTR